MNPTELIDKQIADLGDWRGERMARLRELIHIADPGITEEWKWETAVFTHQGQVCALAPFKEHVKINFFQGATLPDPKGLFNAGLEAKKSRSIDFRAGESIDEAGVTELVRAAVAKNTSKSKSGAAR